MNPKSSKGEFLEGLLEGFLQLRELKDATSNRPWSVSKKVVMHLRGFTSDVIIKVGNVSYSEGS